MKKKLKRSAEVKKLDRIFSKYIRLRDSESEYGKCCTCGELKHYKEAHCGHFIKRGCMPTRWDERNCQLQCLTAESKVRMFNGKNKNIDKLIVGDELWAFNDTTCLLEKAIVQTTESFTPNELYEIKLEDGRFFHATPDHRVVANGEWMYIKDMLHNVSAFDILEI